MGSLPQTIRPENQEGKGNQQIAGQLPQQTQPTAVFRNAYPLQQPLPETQAHGSRHQIQPMQQSPSHIRGAGAMPYAAEREHHQGIEILAGQPFPVASQRDVYIVPEPGAEGDMPAPPELLNGGGKEGAAEILRQIDPQHGGNAPANIHTTGKIRV